MAGLTNSILTQIANKRLAGKAMVNGRLNIIEEEFGSFVQQSNSTIFATALPNNPTQTEWLIQSASGATTGKGSVVFVEFDLITMGDEYQNSSGNNTNSNLAEEEVFNYDLGNTTTYNTNTYHAYSLKLPSDFESNLTNFNANTDTSTNIQSAPFENGTAFTSSLKLQVVPEYVSTITGTSNPYIPRLYDNDSVISVTEDIAYYLDTAAGILFVQNPPGTALDSGVQNNPLTVKAFLYVGKYQNEISGGDTVDLHISASAGTGFSLGNSATASFVSGTAGISVTAGSPNTITIGSANDNVTFNNITASIINADKIEATEYIVSSSITYMTQSFSSGSTIFGDTNDDTHQFTGSISILHTGSDYGFQMSGSNFLIDYGDSGSVTLGEYNVGSEFGFNIYPLTGSGLIISQSFTNETTHHNMVKIGETELVDISGSFQTDAFLINVREKAIVVSSSFLNKPLARFEAGNTVLYASTSNQSAVRISNDNLILGASSDTSTLNGSNLNLLAAGTLKIDVGNGQLDDYVYNPDKNLLIGQDSNIDNGSTGAEVKAAYLDKIYPLFYGAVTASAVSSSGLLFASLSGNPTHNDGILAIVYDTGSGQFYYTGSYGVGGNTTDLEASASAGIHFSTGSGTGISIGLMQTASFTSSGAGLGVDLDGSTFTYTLTPQDVFDAFDTANTGSFTASYANTASFVITASHALTSSKINVLHQETNTFYPITFAELPGTGSVQLYSETGSGGTGNNSGFGLTYNPDAAQVSIGGPGPSLILTSSANLPGSGLVSTTYGITSIITTGSTYGIVNTQGPNGNTNTTLSIGTQTHTINIGAPANYSGSVVNFNNDITIAGSASIEGDLIVRGAVTSIETDNLNVTDQFILLNSGSSGTEDGGIIITRNGGGSGPALFLDSSVSRFAVAKGVAWNNTSEITQATNGTMEYLVSVSSSDTNPTATIEWGDGATSYGQMFVNSGTGEIFIYG